MWPCREAGVDGERRSTAVFRVRLKGRTSGLLDPAARVVVMLWSVTEGQGGLRFTGGEQLLGSGLTGGDGFGAESGACTAWIGDSGLVRLLESRRSHDGAL